MSTHYVSFCQIADVLKRNAKKRLVIHTRPSTDNAPLPFLPGKPTTAITARLLLYCNRLHWCYWYGGWTHSCIILTNFESYLSQNYVSKKEILIMLKPTQ